MSFVNEQVTTFVDRINSAFIPREIRALKNYANTHQVPVLYDESLVFLRFLTQVHAPKKILEIGTAIGYSGIAMLLCSEDSKLFTIEIDEATYDSAARNFEDLNLSSRVKQYLGDAALILGEMSESFDLIFIDAAKAQYLEYFKLCESLMSEHCIAIFDNVLYKGIVAGLPHMRRNNTIEKRLNELFSYIERSKEYEMSLLGVGDGILLVKKRKVKIQ